MYSPKQTKEKILFDGSFASGDFLKWNVVNDDVNQWIVGDQTTYDGNFAAYISNDGYTNAYTPTVAQVSHIYFDVDFPRLLSSADLEFEFKCLGEPEKATMRVYMMDPFEEPQPGVAVDNEFSIGSQFYQRTVKKSTGVLFFRKTVEQTVYDYQASPVWRKEYISLDLSGIRNRTKRFVFSWINTSKRSDLNPPIAIDNVRVSTIIPIINH